jgi:hypothetical protein
MSIGGQLDAIRETRSKICNESIGISSRTSTNQPAGNEFRIRTQCRIESQGGHHFHLFQTNGVKGSLPFRFGPVVVWKHVATVRISDPIHDAKDCTGHEALSDTVLCQNRPSFLER